MKTLQIHNLLQGKETENVCGGQFGGASVSRVKAERSNHAHKNLPMDPILCQMNPFTIPTSRLLNCNITHFQSGFLSSSCRKFRKNSRVNVALTGPLLKATYERVVFLRRRSVS